MVESLEVIVELLRGEYVTRETDWFSIVEGHLHMLPYQRPSFEIAVAALVSPSGPELAGRLGCSMLSIGSTFIDSFRELGVHWDVYETVSAKHGNTADRNRWRLVGPMHIAPTRKQALKEVEYGIQSFIDYELKVANLPLAANAKSPKEAAHAMVEARAAVIGTPEDAVEQIDRLIQQSGGFGTYLHMVTDWADPEARLRSFELFADEVMPHYQGTREPLQASWDWAVERKGALHPKAIEARLAATKAYFGPDHERTRKLEEMFGGNAASDQDRQAAPDRQPADAESSS
jgi:limonene 1,2-monooxygenase